MNVDEMVAVTDGVLDNFIPHTTYSDVEIYRAHAYDQNGVIPSTLFWQADGKYHWSKPQQDRPKPTIVLEEAYFINFFSGDHYGHFITETLSRCKDLLENKINVPLIVFHAKHKTVDGVFGIWPHNSDSRWLKLPEDTINLCENNDICVSVKKLHIANPAFNLYQWIYKEHLDIVRIWRDKQPTWCRTHHSYEKVYLTKTQSPQDNMTTEGEEILETMLDDTWTVIAIEKYPFKEQIQILENARVIAGTRGSAFHNLIFCEKFPDKIIYFCEQKVKSSDFAYALQDTLLGIKENVEWHVYLREEVYENAGSMRCFINIPQAADFLNNL